MSLPALLFFFKSVLTILGSLLFHIDFRTGLFIFSKEPIGDLLGVAQTL